MINPSITRQKSEDTGFLDRLRAATELLESIVSDRGLLSQASLDDQRRLLQAAGHVFAPDVAARRQLVRASIRRRKAERVKREDTVLDQTGIRALRRKPVYMSPNVFPPEGFEQREVEVDPDFRETLEPQHCYVCKQKYADIHHFYDQMCPPCAAFNFAKRTELADLSGRVALLTGGRVKIGYQAGIKLLRSGAHLIVTTRFPRDSAARYAAEPDFEEWGHRLEIFGLDLRHTPSVDAFCRELLTSRDRLDFIVNNACQTVRRPPDFYEHMMARETDDAAPHARAGAQTARLVRRMAGRPSASRRHRRSSGGVRAAATEHRWSGPFGGAVAGPAPRRGAAVAETSLSRGAARSGSAAGRPAGVQLVADVDGRCAGGRAAGGSSGQRRRAVHTQRPPQAADAAHAGAREAHRERFGGRRASSTGISRRRGTRTRTWPRPRST